MSRAVEMRESSQGGFFRAVDRWWFGYGSPVTMGVFRIAMGFLIFTNLVMVGIDFEAWYTERGFVPVDVGALYFHESPRLNLLAGVTDARFTLAFYVLVTLSALLTCIGLWTRVSSIILTLGLITLHHRNGVILNGGDLVMRMGALYIALGPSGASCSVDRFIRQWKGLAPAAPELVSLWPQRLIQFQVALVYFTTVWHKAFGTHWRDGTATYYPLHLNEFHRFWLPDFMRDWPPFIMATTYGTLVVELALATLVFFKPWRKWALLGGVGLHLFIEYAMNIPLFGLLMIATYLSFFEGEEVSAWAKRVGERLKRMGGTVRLPRGKKFIDGPGAAIQSLDAFGLLRYEQGESGTWSAENSAGKPVHPYRFSWIRSIGAWPIGLVPGLWKKLLNQSLDAEPDNIKSEPNP